MSRVAVRRTEIDIEQLARGILSRVPRSTILQVLDKCKKARTFKQYQDDPVGFADQVLGAYLTDDMRELMISVRDNPVTIAKSGNAVGKTFTAAHVAVWWRRCYPASQVYVTAAPPAERNLKKKLWKEILQAMGSALGVFDDWTITASMNITSDVPGEFITGVTIPTSGTEEERESKFSGAHAPHLLFVVDEGDSVPDEVYRAIDSCMSGGHARLLIMFNPRRRAGAAYQKIKDGRTSVVSMSVFRHPNVVLGEDMVPGAVTREQTVKRINEWSIPLNRFETPDMSCFEVPVFLVGAQAEDDARKVYEPLAAGWRRVTSPEMFYMVLGEYPVGGANRLIDDRDVDAAVTRWQQYTELLKAQGLRWPADVRPTFGVDVADEGGDYNSVSIKYGSYVSEFVRWRGVDVDATAMRLVELYAERNAEHTAVESDGLGAGVAPRMCREYYWWCEQCKKSYLDKNQHKCPVCETDCKKVRVAANKVYVGAGPNRKSEMGEFNKMRDQLWWSVREWLKKDPAAMLPPDDDLREELTLPTFENVNGRIRIMSKDTMRRLLGRSPDTADSLLQQFAFVARPRVRVL